MRSYILGVFVAGCGSVEKQYTLVDDRCEPGTCSVYCVGEGFEDGVCGIHDESCSCVGGDSDADTDADSDTDSDTDTDTDSDTDSDSDSDSDIGGDSGAEDAGVDSGGDAGTEPIVCDSEVSEDDFGRACVRDDESLGVCAGWWVDFGGYYRPVCCDEGCLDGSGLHCTDEDGSC